MRTAAATAVLDASLTLLAPSHARAAPVYTFVNFDVPGATGSTTAFGMNNAGQVVGTYCSPGLSQDFLRNVDGTYAIISNPAGPSSTSAYGVNDTGQIVGGYSDSTGVHGFIATPTATAVPELAALDVFAVGTLAPTVRRRRKA